jgi:hypothetical protein
MNEYEIKSLYKKIKKEPQYKQFVNKIDNIKGRLTPKQFLDLQSLLVNASKHENTLKNTILKRLDNKINEFDNNYTNNEIIKIDTDRKIQRSKSIRHIKLKKRKTHRNQKLIKILSPIIEETDSQTKSTGGRKTRKKRSNHVIL